jgi:hypothetical protein
MKVIINTWQFPYGTVVTAEENAWVQIMQICDLA